MRIGLGGIFRWAGRLVVASGIGFHGGRRLPSIISTFTSDEALGSSFKMEGHADLCDIFRLFRCLRGQPTSKRHVGNRNYRKRLWRGKGGLVPVFNDRVSGVPERYVLSDNQAACF